MSVILANFYSSLIPGPASSYIALYTAWFVHTSYQHGAVVMQQKLISLDLDLYEKYYSLVRTDNALKDKFILCIGELHDGFAYVRATSGFTNGSGLGKA